MLAQRNTFPIFLITLILLAGALFMLAPVMASSVESGWTPSASSTSLTAMTHNDLNTDMAHAVQRHGVIEANMGRECSKRPQMTFYNPVTRRTAYMCEIEGFFGFHILDEAGNEITAFIKNKMKRVDQVIKYMENSGYALLH